MRVRKRLHGCCVTRIDDAKATGSEQELDFGQACTDLVDPILNTSSILLVDAADAYKIRLGWQDVFLNTPIFLVMLATTTAPAIDGASNFRIWVAFRSFATQPGRIILFTILSPTATICSESPSVGFFRVRCRCFLSLAGLEKFPEGSAVSSSFCHPSARQSVHGSLGDSGKILIFPNKNRICRFPIKLNFRGIEEMKVMMTRIFDG